MENRYLRQIVLPEVGEAGQKALAQAKVLVVGAGGLGSPCLQYLTAAGVGTIGIVDDDVVDISNLQRQILFSTDEVGQAKATMAGVALTALNPHVKFEIFQERMTLRNALEICSSFDILVDGTDNFSTKFLLNDVSLLLRKPLVYGSISRFEGQVGIFDGQNGPCYRCLYPEAPRSHIGNCGEQGVFGAVPGVVGSMQALEVLKWILFQRNGQDDVKPLIGKIWCADFKTMHFHTLSLSSRFDCLCSKSERSLVAGHSVEVCGVPQQRTWQDYFQSSPRPVLLDARSAKEYEEYHLPEALWGLHDLRYLSKSREIYVYCSMGVRSLQACQDLRSRGYKAFSIKGGLASVIENGKLTIV